MNLMLRWEWNVFGLGILTEFDKCPQGHTHFTLMVQIAFFGLHLEI